MNTRIINILLLKFFFTLVFQAQGQEQTEDMISGALIVVEKENPVRFLMASGDSMNQEIEVGSVLQPGNWALVEKGGKLTLLFSNGTLVTLLPNTKMKVGEFEQIPFEPGDMKVSDLKEEPSSSKVGVDLDFGSLVVKTKKLKKQSTFEIETAMGTAGIRGTEFQFGLQGEAGVQLDVTESTVAFTPPGGSPTAVSQGSGMDFSGTGTVVPRAINPAVAQSIANVTASATLASNDISLSVVTDAMNQTTLESGSSDSGSEEESESEESQGDSEGSQEETDASGGDESKNQDSQNSSTNQSSEASSSNSMIDSLLEADADAKQTRETGKVSTNSKKMAGLPFTQSQLTKFYAFSDSVQNDLLDMKVEDAMRLLDLDKFQENQAIEFFAFSGTTQALILEMEDAALISLLDANFEEDFVVSVIRSESIEAAHSQNLPTVDANTDLDQKVIELGDQLRASGNAEIFAQVEEMNNGSWSESWIEIAEIGNLLYQDYQLGPNLENLKVFTPESVAENPFYNSINSLYNQLFLDRMDVGMSPTTIGGKSISLAPGSYDFSEIMGTNSAILIGATESLSWNGDIELSSTVPSASDILLASGESIEVSAGSNLKSALSNLVVSSREDILLNDATLESAREVAVRSLRDLSLQQSSILASDQIRLRASRNLDVDGLELSQSLPSLIMEATTIRLSNIDFPTATAVQLNSLKGPIDGRYPNFGTGISLEQQLGRVNFIENVRSGGNLMNDRPSFDQFGGNITIGKFLNP